MRAAIVTEFGTSPRYGEFPDPRPSGSLQAVDVVASALKNLDRGLVSGKHYGSASLPLPFAPGVDGVARLDDGRLVYTQALPPHGLMAERTLVDPERVVELPTGVDPVTAAALPNSGLSAWFSLEYAANVRPGDSVLVLGATGVTGSVAVQLAKHRFGAGRVIAVGRNIERLDWLRTHGADDVITLGPDDLGERVRAAHASHSFDAVLDYLWGPPAEQVLGAIANNGLHGGYHATRFVQIGSMAGPDITLPAGVLRSAGITLAGVGIGSVPAEAQARVSTELLPALFAMVADGTLTVNTATASLRDVEQLWTAAEPSGTRTVLVP